MNIQEETYKFPRTWAVSAEKAARETVDSGNIRTVSGRMKHLRPLRASKVTEMNHCKQSAAYLY